jgi:RNA polymerase sigma factor (TIGR02999 family)
MTSHGDVTRLLDAAEGGDATATNALLEAVYGELRTLAAARLAREGSGQTIQATALVHEAYLRLVGDDPERDGRWNGRGHFFGAAAEAMRRILVDQARRRSAEKHGGGRRKVELRESAIAGDDARVDLVALSRALDRLHEESPDKATLVKLRHFTGLTIPQAADALGISHATAERWWRYSRLRLFQWMKADDDPAV